ncbi:MAG TPA: NAD(P)H-hydrate dehydratase, partial [Pyrinomonadaceae bacterium]|nr:NAD(P)H-hydrate dehydratase [Pyrinomonadaceae bacterium]
EEMREVDRLTTEKYGIPSLLLMENAAHAAARVITENLGGSVEGKSFLILCGKGNNGGDGAALARILWNQGAFVSVQLFGEIENTKGEAKINLEIIDKLPSRYKGNLKGVAFNSLEKKQAENWVNTSGFELYHYDVLVDAVFGTGLARPLDEEFKFLSDIRSLKNYYNLGKPFLISLDIPSGLDSNLSKPIGSNFEADLTVTFTAPKPANLLPPASNFNGELVAVNIGSPYELIENSPSQLFLAEKEDAQDWLEKTKFSSDSHKTKRGRAYIIAGSRRMTGAAVLCANAAMRSGIGLIRLATPVSAQNAVSSHVFPEVMVAALPETENGAVSEEAFGEAFDLYENMNVLAIGSGLSSADESTKKFVRKILEQRKSPIVLDADGLNCLAPFDLQGGDEFPLILTPHIGEMRRLISADETEDFDDRVKIAREFARKHHVILVFKGERSLIAAPDGRVVVNPTGNSGLGRAGNGDTLAGIITGFVGQASAMKLDIFEAVVAAVYIGGMAGDIAADKFGKRVMTASDVRECLAEAFRKLERD